MADADSAYGADQSVVNWTLASNSLAFITSIAAFSCLSTTKSFNNNGLWSKIFSIRRHLHPMVTVDERKNEHWYSWIQHVYEVSDTDYLMSAGLDALMTTKFHICAAKIFGLCTFYGIVVLAPVHHSGVTLDEGNGQCALEWDEYNVRRH